VWLAPGVRVAYCSQRPWIQACTLQQNILFGAVGQPGGQGLADARVQDPKRYVASSSDVMGAGWERMSFQTVSVQMQEAVG
jgi:hypothetical protein